MKISIALFVFLFFIYAKQADSVLLIDDRFRERGSSHNTRKGQVEEPDYSLTEVVRLDDKKGPDYRYGNSEVEREGENRNFDPAVVIVDINRPQAPSVFDGWRGKPIFDLFGRMPGFRIDAVGPWWKGPNVCVERKEIVEGAPMNQNFIFTSVHSSCEERDGTYTCTKRILSNEENKSYIEKRQCCYGYKLTKNRCEEVELQGLIPTMKSLGATRFVELLTSLNLNEKLNTDNVTVFCPIDDAITDFEEDEEEMNKIPQGRVVRESSLAKIASGHLVDGYLRSGDLLNNQLLLSANEETKIRITYSEFSGRVMTANCARVIKVDNYATNGVVHLVDSMLPTPSKSVADIVGSNPDLSILKGLLSRANLVQTLRDPNGNFTLFAPTDAAFKNGKIDKALLKKLQDGRGCVASVIKNHLVPYVVCTSPITVAALLSNMIDERLIMTRSKDNKLFVNKSQVISHDIVGTNGVVHIIDEVLMPEKAQTIIQALKSGDMDELVGLIETAGMTEEMEKMQNFTFFAPIPSSLKGLSLSEEEARNKINLHLIPRKVKLCDFHNNQLLETRFENATLRVNRVNAYDEMFLGIASKVTVQCAPVISDNNDVCEGTVHYIDRVLTPTTKNVLQTLEEMENVSLFFQLLQASGLAQRLEEDGPFTILAPTDEAFSKINPKSLLDDKDLLKQLRETKDLSKFLQLLEENGLLPTQQKDAPFTTLAPTNEASSKNLLQRLLDDKEKLQKLLMMHIVPEMRCCAGFGHGLGTFKQHVTTLQGTILGVHRGHHGIRFSNARTLQCDHVATNGVIHVLNKVIEPKIHPIAFFDFF